MTLWVFYSTCRPYLASIEFLSRLEDPCCVFWLQGPLWLRRDCPPYYSMLSNARFAAGAFFISCLLFFFCHLLSAKQAPGAPYAVTAFQSLSHCCRPGCRVTCPQAPFVTRASCAFRSSKTRFKNWLFTSKNCLCQYMP